jgi:hypothetical protein
MRFQFFLLLSSLLLLNSACNNNESENKTKNGNEIVGFKKRTIDLSTKSVSNSMFGTFKFDLSHQKTELFYLITFGSQLEKAKVKIISKDYVVNYGELDENNANSEEVEMDVIESEEEILGKLHMISNNDNFMKCKLILHEHDSYIIYYDKKLENWYIDVESSNFKEFTSKKKALGERIK